MTNDLLHDHTSMNHQRHNVMEKFLTETNKDFHPNAEAIIILFWKKMFTYFLLSVHTSGRSSVEAIETH